MERSQEQNQAEANVNNASGAGSAGGEVVTLPQETYSALLDQLAELEAAATGTPKSSPSVDQLVEEALQSSKKQQGPEVTPEAIQQMNNLQLAQFIVDTISEQGGARIAKLETAIESLKVLTEINQTEKKHEDFWQFEKDVRRIAMRNPTLSIEDAYRLAKAEKGEQPKGQGEEGPKPKSRTETILHLPPRVPGERPSGVTPSSTAVESKGLSIREAALKAWDEVVGKDKTSI